MMKKTVTFLLVAALLAAALTGCGNDDTTEKGPSAQPTVGATESVPSVSEAPAQPAGYLMQFGDKTIGMGSSIEDVKAALGEECTVTEEASCFFEGAQDKNYTYANLSVTTYSKDGAEYVYYIKLFNDLVSTPEGLSIGDAESKVEILYGSNFTVKGSYKCYEKDGMTLRIRISDAGDVNGIDYTLNG